MNLITAPSRALSRATPPADATGAAAATPAAVATAGVCARKSARMESMNMSRRRGISGGCWTR